jgi:hypothetical protein
LRLRASYGENGTLPRQLYLWREGFDGTTYLENSALVQTYIPTQNLTWEKNRIYNIGMDARMFDDRVRISAEYYNRKSRDLLHQVRISSASGGNRTILVNTGAGILNRGFEFDVRANVFQKGKHAVDLTFNLATLKSTYYGLGVAEIDGLSRQILANGESVHAWYMFNATGIDPNTGSILYSGYDNDGRFIIDTNTTSGINRQMIGKQGIPKVSGGFSVGYSYGQWSLSVLCSYGLGHHIYDRIAARNVSFWASDFAISIDQLDRWTPDNPNASTPLRIRNTGVSAENTIFLHRGDYLKIRNIRLQYAMPRKALDAMKLSNAILFMQAENPFIFSHIPGGYDPELSLDGYRHTDSYPSVSTFTIGVSINF